MAAWYVEDGVAKRSGAVVGRHQRSVGARLRTCPVCARLFPTVADFPPVPAELTARLGESRGTAAGAITGEASECDSRACSRP